MSRRKKSSGGRRTRPTLPERNAPPVSDRAPPEPNPPRPNKPLLLITGILLAAWIAFLLVLTMMT